MLSIWLCIIVFLSLVWFEWKWLGGLFMERQSMLRRELMAEIEWKDHCRSLCFIEQAMIYAIFLWCWSESLDFLSGYFIGDVGRNAKILGSRRPTCNSFTGLCGRSTPLRIIVLISFIILVNQFLFSDKVKAMQMLRVAKPGTKIILLMWDGRLCEQQYKKNHFSKDYFKDANC